MKAEKKRFNAVTESRKWKEAVAKKTEGMTRYETLAYFDCAAIPRRIDAALSRADRQARQRVRKRNGKIASVPQQSSSGRKQ